MSSASAPLPLNFPYIRARNYTPAKRTSVDLIVLHTMESQEKPKTAWRVAEWFSGPSAPKASAHYCVDATDIIRCVKDEDVAWAAPGANRNGIHIEMAGRAAQTDAEWSDPFSFSMLSLAARLTALLCFRWDIPVVIVGEQGLLRGDRGITTHAIVTRAFRKSTHTDPGPNFPFAWFIDEVVKYREELEVG